MRISLSLDGTLARHIGQRIDDGLNDNTFLKQLEQIIFPQQGKRIPDCAPRMSRVSRQIGHSSFAVTEDGDNSGCVAVVAGILSGLISGISTSIRSNVFGMVKMA
jgi:hypothetical protein